MPLLLFLGCFAGDWISSDLPQECSFSHTLGLIHSDQVCEELPAAWGIFSDLFELKWRWQSDLICTDWPLAWPLGLPSFSFGGFQCRSLLQGSEFFSWKTESMYCFKTMLNRP